MPTSIFKIMRKSITILAVFALLTALMVGCKGSGVNGIKLPPTITFEGLKNVQFNSIVPVNLLIESQQDVKVLLTVEYATAQGQPYKKASSVPGYVDPRSIGQILIPKGGTDLIFWWHAIADFLAGQKYENVFLRITITTETGDMGEAQFGPITLAYDAASSGGQAPPYVPGGALDPTHCGLEYGKQLPVENGTGPFLWNLLPPGAQLPYYLELTHDGRVKGTIPPDVGPTEFHFVAQVTDSNQLSPRTSAGVFSIFIDCEPVEGCAGPPMIGFEGMPDARVGETYLFTANAFGGEGALTWNIIQGLLPPGILFDPATGLFSGTPLDGSDGSYKLTIKVCDSCFDGIQCDTVEVTLNVNPQEVTCNSPPAIMTSSITGGKEGAPYSFSLQAQAGEGLLSWAVDSGVLPAGVTLTPGGVLTGTPAPGTGGTNGQQYEFTASVCDSCPLGIQCDTATFTLSIAAPDAGCAAAPVIESTSPLPDAAVGQEYNFTFQASGGEGMLIWNLNNAPLPTGLHWDGIGTITGTPQSGSSGVYNLQISVEDSCPEGVQEDSGVFELNINEECPPLSLDTPSLPAAEVDVPYSIQLSASGGVEPLEFDIITGQLPSSMGLDFDGTLSGTPVSGEENTYQIEIRVRDNCSPTRQSDSNLFNFVVNPASGCGPEPQIVNVDLGSACEGQEYSKQLELNFPIGDFTGPVMFALLDTNDLLPANLVLSGTDGIISGIPDVGTEGIYDLNFQVSDSCDPPQVTEALLQLEVIAGCDPGPSITSTSPIPEGTANIPYSYPFTSDAGHGSVRWGLESGDLPPSLVLSQNGLLSGPLNDPGDVGTWNFTVIACDSCPCGLQCDTLDVELVINPGGGGCAPPPNVTSASDAQIPAGMFVDFLFEASDGEGLLTWTLQSALPPLPVTITLSPEGILLGTTTAADAGIYQLGVQVCDECTDPGPQCVLTAFSLELVASAGCSNPAPVITDVSVPAPSADNSPYSYTMTATDGDLPLQWFATGLPPGIVIDKFSGELSGAVDPASAGTYTILIGCIDACGNQQADSKEYVWDVI